MNNSRLPEMPKTIDSESMRVFLVELKKIGLLCHIDDNPLDMGFYNFKGEWVSTFSTNEAYALIGFFSMATGVNGNGPLTWDDIWDVFPMECMK